MASESKGTYHTAMREMVRNLAYVLIICIISAAMIGFVARLVSPRTAPAPTPSPATQAASLPSR